MIKRIVSFLFLFLISGVSFQAHARVLLRLDDALKNFFAGCKVKEENFFLTPEQVKRAEDIAGIKVDSKLLSRRVATCSGTEKFIYLDTHVVRTQREVLMIVIGQDVIERVELLSFYEPDEYIPGKKWYELFQGKKSNSVKLGESIPHISGASLTARSSVSAVKKIVALHEATSNVKK